MSGIFNFSSILEELYQMNSSIFLAKVLFPIPAGPCINRTSFYVLSLNKNSLISAVLSWIVSDKTRVGSSNFSSLATFFS